MTYYRGIVVVLLASLLGACASVVTLVPVTSIKRMQPQRYQGNWYEIASIPTAYQDSCYCTTSHYRWHQQRFYITNRCWQGNRQGRLLRYHAIATPLPGSHYSRFKIQYHGHHHQGDYWILALDKHYRYAMIGTVNRQHLWILSRSPELADKSLQHLIKLATTQGFPTQRLVLTEQSC